MHPRLVEVIMIREARRRKWLGISGASGVSRKPGFGDDLRTRSARIARALTLSENTVKKYLFRIFEKLGISSRVELVLYAVSRGRSEAD